MTSASFGKVSCEPTWKWDTTEHPVPDYDLWYAWDGEGQVTLNGIRHEVGPGTCFLFRPGDRAYATHNLHKPLTVTFIHFDRECLKDIPFPSCRPILETLVFEMLLTEFVRARFRQEPDEADLLLRLLLRHYLHRAERQGPESGDQVSRLEPLLHDIAHHIRQNPGFPHTIKELAEQAQLSPRYFSLKFKKCMGETIESFLIRTKIERAEHLLRYNGMNVTEVAEALGYSNIYYFSRQFKKYRGFPPSDVRGRL